MDKETYLAALEYERKGYAFKGKPDRAKEVEAEIARTRKGTRETTQSSAPERAV